MLKHFDYMAICEILSQASYCDKNKVGAIMVKNGNIIAQSYNGTISGFDNQCEDEFGNTKPEVCHAEANLITKVAMSTNSSFGATVYTTLAPCIECAKLLIQAGILAVYYKKEYRLPNGLNLLRKADIQVQKVDDYYKADDSKITTKTLDKAFEERMLHQRKLEQAAKNEDIVLTMKESNKELYNVNDVKNLLITAGNYKTPTELVKLYLKENKFEVTHIVRKRLVSSVTRILSNYKDLFGHTFRDKIKRYYVL